MCRNVIFWGRFNNRRPQPGARVHLVLLGASVQLCALRIVEVLVRRANPEEDATRSNGAKAAAGSRRLYFRLARIFSLMKTYGHSAITTSKAVVGRAERQGASGLYCAGQAS